MFLLHGDLLATQVPTSLPHPRPPPGAIHPPPLHRLATMVSQRSLPWTLFPCSLVWLGAIRGHLLIQLMGPENLIICSNSLGPNSKPSIQDPLNLVLPPPYSHRGTLLMPRLYPNLSPRFKTYFLPSHRGSPSPHFRKSSLTWAEILWQSYGA